MIKIYVARHGQNVDNKNGILNGHRDEPLTDLGEQQASLVAEEIKKEGLSFDVVYSSPLQRAFKTAKIISDVSNQPQPIILKELIERDFGIMTGIEANRIEELCSPEIIKTETITYFLNPKGAETFEDLLVRAKKLLDFIKEKHDNQSVLLVTHGDFGKMIYTEFYKLQWEKVLTDFHFGNSEVLYLSEDCDLDKTRLFTSKQYNH